MTRAWSTFSLTRSGLRMTSTCQKMMMTSHEASMLEPR
jgi:hypothetical protein